MFIQTIIQIFIKTDNMHLYFVADRRSVDIICFLRLVPTHKKNIISFLKQHFGNYDRTDYPNFSLENIAAISWMVRLIALPAQYAYSIRNLAWFNVSLSFIT